LPLERKEIEQKRSWPPWKRRPAGSETCPSFSLLTDRPTHWGRTHVACQTSSFFEAQTDPQASRGKIACLATMPYWSQPACWGDSLQRRFESSRLAGRIAPLPDRRDFLTVGGAVRIAPRAAPRSETTGAMHAARQKRVELAIPGPPGLLCLD
jgi:hypothetical protein